MVTVRSNATPGDGWSPPGRSVCYRPGAGRLERSYLPAVAAKNFSVNSFCCFRSLDAKAKFASMTSFGVGSSPAKLGTATGAWTGVQEEDTADSDFRKVSWPSA